ncbi:MAG: hypothetical protein L6Q95_08620, partial [Planctomycetes bacterium]|nr:hypothetical protein [Planctomycetota bacterium]
KAGGRDFDDSRWEVVEDLSARRSTGRVCFGWYRIRLTVPGEAKGATRRASPRSTSGTRT